MVTVEVTFLRRSFGHGFKGLEFGVVELMYSMFMWMVAAKNYCGNLSGAQLPKAFVPVKGVLLCCVDLNCNTTAT